MRSFLIIGGCCVAAILGGAAYYFHQPPMPPPPKDAAAHLPARFREKVTPEQLAMLRGERYSAPLVSASPITSANQMVADAPLHENGLLVELSGTMSELKGKLVNETAAEIPYQCSAGTLFSNGAGQVVALKDVSVPVPSKATVDLAIPVAATSSANVSRDGHFQREAGNLAALAPVLKAIAQDSSLSPGAVQTAVLAVTENVSLDVVAKFPSLLPNFSVRFDPRQPWRVSNLDLMTALTLLKSSGINLGRIELMQDPQLEIMALLNADSHDAARKVYGISNQGEWSYWKNQLLTGDPSLRHVALYGIARYYPDVAVDMLPRWVQAEKLPHTYRVAAAAALGLIADSRATEQLLELKQRVNDNISVQQAILHAINH